MVSAKKLPSKKPSPRKSAPKKRALLAALRDRAEAVSKAAEARHLRDARAALARAKTALETAEAGLYEVALALGDLSDARLLAALGEKSIYTAAATHLGLSRSTVDRLRRAADAVDAERFAELGHTKFNAMLELADATPADDADAILAGRSVVLWEGGPTIDLKASSVKDLTLCLAPAAIVTSRVMVVSRHSRNRREAPRRGESPGAAQVERRRLISSARPEIDAQIVVPVIVGVEHYGGAGPPRRVDA